MNNDGNDMNEQELNELRGEPTELDSRPGFRAELRANLSDEWNGRPTMTPGAPVPHAGRPTDRRWLLGAAAAAVVLIIGGIVVISGNEDGAVVSPGPVTGPTQPEDTQPDDTQPDTTVDSVVDSIVGAPTTVVEPLDPVLSTSTTEAPGPSTSSTAAPSATTSSTTVVPPTTVPATVLPTLVPERLSSWPAPSAEPGSLDSIPRLLPTVPVPGASTSDRSEGASPPIDSYDYTQMFYGTDGVSVLEMTTNIGQFMGTPQESRIPVDVEGWDEAFFSRSAPGFDNMQLVAPEGTVVLSSQGLGQDAVTEIARSLSRRPDGRPGWDVRALPPTLVPFGEGGDDAPASRSVMWRNGNRLVAQLWIVSEIPSVMRTAFEFDNPSASVTKIGDFDAVAGALVGPRSVVTWSPEPGLFVQFGYDGPLDEALAIARSIQPVDAATWEAVPLNTSTNDGCVSLFC